MIIEEVITNAMDLAGGDLIRHSLSRNLATLYCLNIIDTMMLELANSSKAIKGYKENITLLSGVNSGELPQSSLVLQDFFICYKDDNNGVLQFIEVFDDIEDLKRAEVDGKKGILFTGFDTRTYHLSFKPEKDITAEMWGKRLGDEITNLNDLAPFPKEFALLCAYRIADFVLNQLLLIDAQRFQAFIMAQKLSLLKEQERLEHIWKVYRANPASANTFSQVEEYDWRKEQDADGFSIFGRH